MEIRHRCKLCWRRFGSGRALGGHMRSHVMNPSMYSNAQQLAEEEEDEEEVNGMPVILQDGESESETSRRILTRRRRSKRLRPASAMSGCQEKKLKCEAVVVNRGSESSWTELVEQGSSVSDSTVEDVAFCLMMLSRDKWNTPEEEQEEEVRAVESEEEEEEEDSDDSTKLQEKMTHAVSNQQKKLVLSKERYKCETCFKTFSSYQALGGHRASHNKIKPVPKYTSRPSPDPKIVPDPRIHPCPVCHRVFPSGQALGGHKRSHAILVPEMMQKERAPVRCGDVVIDLNFPAPADEDDAEAFRSQH